MKLYHNSRESVYRSPFGALPCGTAVTLRLMAEGKQLSVILRTWKDGAEYRYPMRQCGGGLFEATITLKKPGNLWYFFIVDNGHKIQYYGNARDNLGGEGKTASCKPSSYQINVYRKNANAPEWMRDAIVYQVLLDRFYASKSPNPSNYVENAGFHSSILETPTLIVEGHEHPARDFYGGDLNGLIEKLPYLQSLGIRVVYLNPIFSAPSNHKYDTADYETIDKGFGTEENFIALCEAAKTLGIRIILDGVFSHTGSDSRYFNRYNRFDDLGAFQSKESPYFCWYKFSHWPDKYESWWGFQTLPEVNKTTSSFKDYIINNEDAICAHWLKAGASGWRLDVTDELPLPFLRALRKRIKAFSQDRALIGEVWEDGSNKVAYGVARNYLTGDTLDSLMNYPLRDGLIEFMLFRISASVFIRRAEALRENYPPQFFYSMLNLLGSHDTPRILAILAGRDDLKPPWEERRPIELSQNEYELAKRRLVALWQFLISLPGMPCLYYGDEAGLVGMDDPFNRGAYPWGHEDVGLIHEISEANALRNAHAVLRTGHIHLQAVSEDIVVCERYPVDGRDAFGKPCGDARAVFTLDRVNTVCDSQIVAEQN